MSLYEAQSPSDTLPGTLEPEKGRTSSAAWHSFTDVSLIVLRDRQERSTASLYFAARRTISIFRSPEICSGLISGDTPHTGRWPDSDSPREHTTSPMDSSFSGGSIFPEFPTAYILYFLFRFICNVKASGSDE